MNNLWASSMSTHLATPAYKIDHPSVYPPSEDTFLLLDALEAERGRIAALNPCLCVEKLVEAKQEAHASTSDAQNFHVQRQIICTDVNSHALQCTRQTFQLNGLTSTQPLLVCCNLLSPLTKRLRNSVDILVMNPPYVLTEKSAQSEQELSYAGGPSGRALLDQLLPHIASILSPNGLFYLVALKENGVDELISTATRDRLAIEGAVVIERQCRNEHLFVLRFTRADARSPSAHSPLTGEANTTAAAMTATPIPMTTAPQKTPAKVTIHLRPVGGAPQLEAQYRKLATNPNQSVAHISRVLRKWIGLGPTDSLFLFVNDSFAPFPEHTIGNLYDCFGSRDSRKLYLQYSLTPAWG
uniref:Methyltransferase HEMK2 n=1 Tax=Globodera rostochiensis TaxID=31243 RepID=A0A914H071_GLORO